MSDSKPAFCTNCGAPLTPGNAFCDQCGHRIVAEQAQPSPAPSAPTPVPTATPLPPATAKPPFKSLLMIAIILVALILGVVGAVVFERLRKTDGEPENTAAIPTPPDKPAILADPVGAFDDKSTPPVEVAYIHFLDEAHRLTKGNIRVGSPTSTPTRIEVRVTAQNARPETVVVLEKFNNGRQATVIVGPKDAGAVRSYTLILGPGGWTIQSFQDLDG